MCTYHFKYKCQFCGNFIFKFEYELLHDIKKDKNNKTFIDSFKTNQLDTLRKGTNE